MGDSMHTVLTVGPLTSEQKRNLPEVLGGFLRYEGIGYRPKPLEEDPSRLVFTLGDINYGVTNLGSAPGRIDCLIDAGIPYRITDDGGSYANGTDVIWHPDFGELPPLSRQANQEGKVVVTETLIENLSALDDQTFGQVIRGLVESDPSKPQLLDAYRAIEAAASERT